VTDYVASPPTTDAVKLLREKDIAIDFLPSECDRLEAEIATRDATIQELTIDLIQAEQQAAQPAHTYPDLTVRPRAAQAAIRAC
jgi:hypothetical protein